MDAPPTILIIEGNEGHSLLIREKVLESFPWAELHCAKTLHDAWDLLPQRQWDLILLNANLPDGEGGDFLEELSARQPFAAVAVLTEEISEQVLRNTHHRGTLEFLVKDRQTLDSLAMRVKRLLSSNQSLRRLLQETETEDQYSSFRDPLTRAYNRAYFEDALRREISRANRYGHEFALLVADVDGLSRINEEQGHEEGNQCLKKLATILSRSIRSGDLVARYEADRFTLLLPHCRKADAIRCAARVLKKVRAESSEHGFSVSIGVLHYQGEPVIRRPEAALSRAKAALSWAKSHGGDRYHVAA